MALYIYLSLYIYRYVAEAAEVVHLIFRRLHLGSGESSYPKVVCRIDDPPWEAESVDEMGGVGRIVLYLLNLLLRLLVQLPPPSFISYCQHLFDPPPPPF